MSYSSQLAGNRLFTDNFKNQTVATQQNKNNNLRTYGGYNSSSALAIQNQPNRPLLRQHLNNEAINKTPLPRYLNLEKLNTNASLIRNSSLQLSNMENFQTAAYKSHIETNRTNNDSMLDSNSTPQFSHSKKFKNYYNPDNREQLTNEPPFADSYVNRYEYNFSNNSGFNNDNKQLYLNQQQDDSLALPSILLNSAMGKSPTSTKQLNFFYSNQNGHISQRNILQKRPITPEGLPISKNARYNYSNYPDISTTPRSRSSYHGSINNDELPPVATFDDDNILNTKKNDNSDLFGIEQKDFHNSNAYGNQSPNSLDSSAAFFDNDWIPEDVVDSTILMYGASKTYKKVISEHFEQYGPIKAILAAPENGNWAIIVFEYPESATKVFNVAQENKGKILIDNGRVLLGVESTNLNVIKSAKKDQNHIYLKSQNAYTNSNHDIISSNNINESSIHKPNNYSELNVHNFSARNKNRRLGPVPPRRQSHLLHFNNTRSSSSYNSTPKSRNPFPNAPTNLSNILSDSKLKPSSKTHNRSLFEDSTISNKSLTPLNIKPRSSLLQSAVDMLFGW
ncbi:hypothetical protein BB561_001617 [Smittium simulii]|uniref:Uncharacterized protein n=1 Tax=Smittium simulii TaxID=133385 RepID=A0A2T9YTW9_9FUNG|nr:hypothetical protein BB561_003079 [Smittium simulii]PVU95771.1 hypothetical protein BB561_001617 [Smittium simulii]